MVCFLYKGSCFVYFYNVLVFVFPYVPLFISLIFCNANQGFRLCAYGFNVSVIVPLCPFACNGLDDINRLDYESGFFLIFVG